jgi:two-component system response regulator DesR
MRAMKKITILVVEDQSLIRDAIASLLELEDDIDVVGKCRNGQEACDFLATNTAPDIVLSDIEMPIMSGLELGVALHERHYTSKLIIMTTFAKTGYVKRAISLGAQGFVLKEADSDYLLNAIYKVHAGERIIAPELALMALDDNNPLTDKECAALKLASDGVKTHDIATALFLSEGTVRNYLSEAISKLDATNRVDAARIALQKGWL